MKLLEGVKFAALILSSRWKTRRCTAAALPMAAFLELMSRSGSGLWIILPCVVIYGAMCLLLRCVSAQDLAMVQQILARRA